MSKVALLYPILCLHLAACQSPTVKMSQPEAPPPVPFTEMLHGEPRTDAYRWMESEDPKFLDWAKREAAWARYRLDQIPGRETLYTEINQLDVPSAGYGNLQLRAGQWIYEKLDPETKSRATFTRGAAGGAETSIALAALITTDGEKLSEVKHARVLSPDGRYITFGTIRSGETEPQLHVYDLQAQIVLPETIDWPLWADSRGFRPRWLSDSSGFFYVRNPDANADMEGRERASQGVVFLHVLGTAVSDDKPVFGFGLNPGIDPADTTYVEGEPIAGWLPVLVRKPVGREIWVVELQAEAGQPGNSRRLFKSDELVPGFGIRKDRLYTLDSSGAERYRLVAVDIDKPDGPVNEILSQQEGVLRNLHVGRDAVYVVESRLEGSRLHVISDGGHRSIQLPDGSVESVSAGPDGDGVWIEIVDWLTPRTGWLITSDDPVPESMDSQNNAQLEQPRNVSELHWAIARDGVRVPYTVVRRADTVPDGSAFVLISGYGCFGTVNSPFYWPALEAWLQRGGIFVQAGVRGGGELGAAWHQAGSDRAKPTSFEDTIDTARQLIVDGWTEPGRIGLMGGSCGGATMGMAALEAPHLFGAAALSAAALDMNRIAAVTAAGPRTIREFGDPATQEGARRIDALSPYRQLLPFVSQPAFLIMSGAGDYTIPLWMGGKFVAAARLANPEASVMWRVDWDAGHNAGRDYSREDADVMAFMLWKLGHPDFQPEPGQ